MEILMRRKPQNGRLRLASSCVDGPLRPEVVEEGRELFEDFMAVQIDTDLPQLRPVVQESALVPARQRDVNKNIGQTAARLRQLATSFSQSDERRQVREMAMEINSDISGEELGFLLMTMFTNSEHVEEGIVVIFFFCFDLVARMVKNGLQSYKDILEICKVAIIKALGPKVQENGGWNNSIQSATGNSVAMGIITTGMLVVARLGLRTLFNV